MSHVDDEIKKVINEIVSNINHSWTLNQKIRFIYLKLGECLEKNTDFFENSKLLSYGLTSEEMNEIYENNKISIVERNGIKQYQIICKSAALFLKTAFDILGIKSSYVHTVNSVDGVLHWFLVVKGDEGEQFFLTLAADLPYIKNEFPTDHFANNIDCIQSTIFSDDKKVRAKDKLVNRIISSGNILTDYKMYFSIDNQILIINKRDDSFFDIQGYIGVPHELSINTIGSIPLDSDIIFIERYYDIQDIDKNINLQINEKNFGSIKVKYQEISHKSLNYDKDELYKLDCSIGYEKLYDSTGLITPLEYKNFYYTLSEEDSEIYNIFRKSFGIEPGGIKKIDSITLEEVDNFKDSIEKYLLNELNNIYFLNITDLRDYIFLSISLKDKNDYNISLNELVNKYKKDLKKCSGEEKFITGLIQSVLFIENCFYDYLDVAKKLDNLMSNEDIEDDDFVLQYKKIIERYDKAKCNLSIRKFNLALNRVAFSLIKKDISVDNNINVSTEYIINKFTKMFPIIFDCNYENKRTVLANDFSSLGYSEQIVIIKTLLKKIFPELNENNCKNVKKYNSLYSPLENRLRIFPLKNKKTGEYCIGFRFTRTESEDLNDNDEYVYIPSDNLLRKRNPLRDQQTYWIVSRSLNSRLSEIENNEVENKKIK